MDKAVDIAEAEGHMDTKSMVTEGVDKRAESSIAS